MSWDSIKKIMPQAIQKSGIREQVTAVRVLQISEQVLGARWGQERASLVVFVSFASGILKIQTASPAAMQMLGKERLDITNAINHALGQRAVVKMDIRSSGF